MLTMLFLTCAVVGGALVAAQLLLSVVAFGAGHGLHLHHHGGGGHRFSFGRGGSRIHGGIKSAGAKMSASAKPSAHGKIAHSKIAHGMAIAAVGHRALAWVQSMFNLQGIVAGITVLGLAGLAATAAKLSSFVSLQIAIAAALLMMALMEAAFELMTSMDNEGTLDIQQAVGKVATVYLGIPANNGGRGKITVNVQDRLMEFAAITLLDAPLLTGQKVTIVAIQDAGVMQVVSAEETASNFPHANNPS